MNTTLAPKGTAAPGPAVSTILYLLDDAFDGNPWHSLLGNLKSVTNDDWLWVPPDGRRSIRDIVQHVASGKEIYHNYAFGDASLKWDDPNLEDPSRVATKDLGTEWLREAHSRLRASVAALSDDDLSQPRMHFRRRLEETRWLITVTIGHDFYHAGEINHIRCLHQGDDE